VSDDVRGVTMYDRLTVATQADGLLLIGRQYDAVARTLLDAVRCCDHFPECSHVLIWSETYHDAA